MKFLPYLIRQEMSNQKMGIGNYVGKDIEVLRAEMKKDIAKTGRSKAELRRFLCRKS